MKRKQSEAAIRKTLEKQVVTPLFSHLNGKPKDTSVPAVVLESWREEARNRLVKALAFRGTDHVPPELRKAVEGLLERWEAESFSPTSREIASFEIDCAKQRDLAVAEASGDEAELLRTLEREYRRQVLEQFGQTELRGVQTSHRVMLDLERVYVPLYLEEILSDAKSMPLRQRVPVQQVLQEHKRILIIGAPGSGKSTLVAYLVREFARGAKTLPFPSIIRTIDKHHLTAGTLVQSVPIDSRLLEDTLRRKRGFFFFDGVDEADPKMRGSLVSAINEISRKYADIPIVVTSRPSGSSGEVERWFRDFQAFRLVDLTSREVDDFVDKWCLAAETSIQSNVSAATKAAKAAAADLKERIAQSRSVQRMVSTPLLVTILCVVHRFLGRKIPEHRIVLYDKCMDALLYEWDQAKFSKGAAIGALTAQQKRTLLRGLARRMHEAHEAEIPEDAVIEHFAEVLPNLGQPSDDAKKIVYEIRDRSGVLVERRPGYFGFSHLSFQEYLTALDYVREKKWTVLAGKQKDPWWHEVIALSAGVEGSDPGKIAQSLLAAGTPLATILAAQCLETAVDMPLKLRRVIEARLNRLIPPKTQSAAKRLTSVGPSVAPLLLKALPRTEVVEKYYTLNVLSDVCYEPAIPVMLTMTKDRSSRGRGYWTVGEWAILALVDMAPKSRNAIEAVIAALREPQSETLLFRVRDCPIPEIKRAALKAPRLDIPAPKRAKSTG